MEIQTLDVLKDEGKTEIITRVMKGDFVIAESQHISSIHFYYLMPALIQRLMPISVMIVVGVKMNTCLYVKNAKRKRERWMDMNGVLHFQQ